MVEGGREGNAVVEGGREGNASGGGWEGGKRTGDLDRLDRPATKVLSEEGTSRDSRIKMTVVLYS